MATSQSTSLTSPDRNQGALRRLFGPITSHETWAATGFLLSSLALGIFWFTVTVTLLVTGAATLVAVIGIPISLAAWRLVRAGAAGERRRVGRGLGVAIAEPPSVDGQSTGWQRLSRETSDPTNRRSAGYLVGLLPYGVLGFATTVAAWVVPLGLLSTPILVAIGINPAASSQSAGWEIVIDSMPQALWIAVAGAVLLPVAPRVIRRVADAHVRFARNWLTPA